MKVRVSWEVEVGVNDCDPKCVDVPALAKELAKVELAANIMSGELTVDDLEYSVVV